MIIPLLSTPLQDFKEPFWSWVSWNKCWLENKGNLLVKSCIVFIFVNVSFYCDSRAINCLTIVCDYGIILCVRAFKHFCWAWHAFERSILNLRISYNGDLQLEFLTTQLILAWISWVLFVWIHAWVLCSTVWDIPFKRFNLSFTWGQSKV